MVWNIWRLEHPPGKVVHDKDDVGRGGNWSTKRDIVPMITLPQIGLPSSIRFIPLTTSLPTSSTKSPAESIKSKYSTFPTMKTSQLAYKTFTNALDFKTDEMAYYANSNLIIQTLKSILILMQMKGRFSSYQERGGLVNQSKLKFALCQNFCQPAKLSNWHIKLLPLSGF